MNSKSCEEEKDIIQTRIKYNDQEFVITIQRVGENANLVRKTITKVPPGWEKGKTYDLTPVVVYDRADAFQDKSIRAMADTLAEYIKRVLDR